MTDVQLSRLERVDIAEVWKSKPMSFTPWLAENLDLLRVGEKKS